MYLQPLHCKKNYARTYDVHVYIVHDLYPLLISYIRHSDIRSDMPPAPLFYTGTFREIWSQLAYWSSKVVQNECQTSIPRLFYPWLFYPDFSIPFWDGKVNTYIFKIFSKNYVFLCLFKLWISFSFYKMINLI